MTQKNYANKLGLSSKLSGTKLCQKPQNKIGSILIPEQTKRNIAPMKTCFISCEILIEERA